MDNDKLFSLEMLENSDNSILNRIADQVNDEDAVDCSASHSSHSSSSGRGHSSYVSGSVSSVKKDKMKKNMKK